MVQESPPGADQVLVVIPARYGSTRFPGEALADLSPVQGAAQRLRQVGGRQRRTRGRDQRAELDGSAAGAGSDRPHSMVR